MIVIQRQSTLLAVGVSLFKAYVKGYEVESTQQDMLM